MKKTIFYLGLALVAFSNVTLASNVETATRIELAREYGNNNTPLCNAICKGDVEAVKKFIEYGADVNEKSNGKTPLMLAARYNNIEIVKLLLEKGASKSIKDEKGNTALKYAEASNAKEAADLLRTA